MRVIFWGTPHWALYPLEAINEKEELIAVVCQPDKPAGRGLKLQTPPTKEFALSKGIPVFQPDKLKDETFIEKLRELSPDLCVICAYGKYIPPEILDIPQFGFLNLHPSLLPRWRGADPIRWTILAGDEKTGVTIHYASEKMDAGDIILQKEIPVLPRDTYGSLAERLFREGTNLLLEAIELIKEGKAPRFPQNESEATYAPLLKSDDFLIDWQAPAEKIDRLVRAGNPTPGAFTFLRGKRLKIWDCRIVEGKQANAGEIIGVEREGIRVGCGKDALLIRSLQMEGKNSLSGEEFARGYRIKEGEVLG
ncbi:methionyl-tRNA formyltransferase [bacterium]|nr:methionyl-tRNA formyltransferase [bacterium]